ncbi:hypothetical protein NDU88_001822 [Pleurodeles waltl]|uniref:Uncharacterized protein n=1 Tax=Pleurodeles waltl TaxID=8319 RepID=A0AAV7R879_PLEWA|nr:hypothetical protein NDU88_001822 [Pleurodeles waltl]
MGVTAWSAGEYIQNVAFTKERNGRVSGRVPGKKTGLGNKKQRAAGHLLCTASLARRSPTPVRGYRRIEEPGPGR